MYSQRVNIPLQDLDRHALTVEAISGPTAKLEPSVGAISSVMGLYTVVSKSTLEKQTS